MVNKTRFAVGAEDGPASGVWQVRTSASDMDIYIERRDLRANLHISLHASGQFHIKQTGLPGPAEVMKWRRPDPHHPGYTRVFHINIASIGLKPKPRHSKAGVHWLDAGAEGSMVEVTVWTSRSEPSELAGMIHGTRLVDRLDVVDGSALILVSRVVPCQEVVKRSQTRIEDLTTSQIASFLRGNRSITFGGGMHQDDPAFVYETSVELSEKFRNALEAILAARRA
jgi:hypothetical protein